MYFWALVMVLFMFLKISMCVIILSVFGDVERDVKGLRCCVYMSVCIYKERTFRKLVVGRAFV